jgi:hypothetical protein
MTRDPLRKFVPEPSVNAPDNFFDDHLDPAYCEMNEARQSAEVVNADRAKLIRLFREVAWAGPAKSALVRVEAFCRMACAEPAPLREAARALDCSHTTLATAEKLVAAIVENFTRMPRGERGREILQESHL